MQAASLTPEQEQNFFPIYNRIFPTFNFKDVDSLIRQSDLFKEKTDIEKANETLINNESKHLSDVDRLDVHLAQEIEKMKVLDELQKAAARVNFTGSSTTFPTAPTSNPLTQTVGAVVANPSDTLEASSPSLAGIIEPVSSLAEITRPVNQESSNRDLFEFMQINPVEASVLVIEQFLEKTKETVNNVNELKGRLVPIQNNKEGEKLVRLCRGQALEYEVLYSYNEQLLQRAQELQVEPCISGLSELMKTLRSFFDLLSASSSTVNQSYSHYSLQGSVGSITRSATITTSSPTQEPDPEPSTGIVSSETALGQTPSGPGSESK